MLRPALVVLALCIFAPGVTAEKLSLRQYRIADGLAHNSVRVIRQDSKGYLWIGTGEGVSRFDGYRFVNYSTSEGLSVPLINDIVEDPRGRMWIATNGAGVARFLDNPATRAWAAQSAATGSFFQPYTVGDNSNTNQVNAVVFDGDTMWCATDGGLFRARVAADDTAAFALVGREEAVKSLLKTRGGALVVTAAHGVYEIAGDRITEFGRPADDQTEWRDLVEFEGAMIALTERALYRLEIAPPPGVPAWSRFDVSPGRNDLTLGIFTDSAGWLWIASSNALTKKRGSQLTRLTTTEGLPRAGVIAFLEDRDRNLWMGTELDGLVTFTRPRLVSYDVNDGLPEPDIVALSRGNDGAIFAFGRSFGWSRLRDGQIVKVTGSEREPFNRIGKRFVCETTACWALTDRTLLKLDKTGDPATASTRLTLPAGAQVVSISGRAQTGLLRDNNGTLWFATNEPALYRLENPSDNESPVTRMTLSSREARPLDPMAPIAQDPSGAIWVASMSALGRVRNGVVELTRPDDGLSFDPRSAFVDSRGWLWIGLRYGGVVVTREPAAVRPSWSRYSTSNGLGSNAVWSIVEDRRGELYLATNRGLDRLNPTTGEVTHFMTSEGLAGDVVSDCVSDSDGRIWLATSGGVSRLDPADASTQRAPVSILITHVEAGNDSVALPATGTAAASGIRVEPGSNRLLVQFVGLAVGSHRELRYQYQLEGLEPGWSAPTAERVVTYAGLGPGSYRFRVRALDASGEATTTPAVVEFKVLPPVWQRPWFIAGGLFLFMVTGYAGHQQRVRRIRASDALRRQVATDLHDDVGSGLSEIAVMSEVLRRQMPDSEGVLTNIARTARSLRDSMSDIVWAVGPNTDRPSDLVDRMRQAAFTLLDFEGLRVQFDAPPKEQLDRVQLAADVRRQLLLMFKEAVTNVARHARASQLSVRIAANRRTFTIEILDNGVGFHVDHASSGHGLASLEQRARKIGGQLTVESRPGAGALVRIEAPQT